MSLRIFTFIFASLLCQTSFGFVQNVTHGYPACIACHVSPNGGGLLTDYGRSLSKELMSTWGASDRFAQPYFGAFKNRETVKFGGDLRTIQTWLKNDNIDQGRAFPMQQNLEVGVKVDNVMLVTTAGLRQGPEGFPDRGTFLSERHYALWSPSPTSKLRVGKFRQTFGINTPNHTRLVKNLFGFGSLSETYNVEFTKFFETYEVTVGSSMGRIDNPQTNSEKNVSAHYTYYLNENSRVGGSLLLGESNLERRTLGSLNAVIPLAKEWILMTEVDYERAHSSATPQQGEDTLATLLRLGNTPFKGVMWYVLFQHASIDRGSSYTLQHQPGVGIQWLPIPHFNIQIEYSRAIVDTATPQTPGSYQNPNEVGFLILHTYL